MGTLAYIKIKYSDHTYNATVNNLHQLETYLSSDLREFKFTDVDLVDPAAAQGIANMLNRISNFGHCLNKSATCR